MPKPVRKPVRIAMLGSGFVADFYMQGLANVKGQEVAVNFSLDGKKAKKFARKWGIAESSSNLAQMIERDDIDLYVIALPNEAHMPVSVLLSQAKRNQVCTKPLGPQPRRGQADVQGRKEVA